MKNLNAIPLSALRVIEAVARTGSLTRAADEMGVTPGALSQRLAKAEEALGQPLFLREAQGMRPTEACARVASRLSQSMAGLSSVVADLRNEQCNDVVTVTVAPIFASRWLIWRIGAFTAAHPQISLRLLPSAEVVDLDRSDVDAAIRFRRSPRAGTNVAEGEVKLLDQRVFPVCSVDLAATIKSPRDLVSLPVIRENDRLAGWAEWLAAHGLSPSDLRPGPTYADASLCLDAAMLGQGVFMAWQTLASDAVARGQVVAPLPGHWETGASYWFAASKWSARNPAVRKFRDWLLAEMAKSFGGVPV